MQDKLLRAMTTFLGVSDKCVVVVVVVVVEKRRKTEEA